jgi:hypothetical protein
MRLRFVVERYRKWFGNAQVMWLLLCVTLINANRRGLLYALISSVCVCIAFPPLTLILDFILKKFNK